MAAASKKLILIHMQTLETTEQLQAATENSFALFVPNKPSVGTLIISPGYHPNLYRFLNDYFYWWDKGTPRFKPYAYAEMMLMEIEEESFDDAELPVDEEEAPPFSSIQHYLKTVIDNYGEHTIVVCSHYQ